MNLKRALAPQTEVRVDCCCSAVLGMVGLGPEAIALRTREFHEAHAECRRAWASTQLLAVRSDDSDTLARASLIDFDLLRGDE